MFDSIKTEPPINKNNLNKIFVQAMDYADKIHREPAPHPPDGGISQSAGSRKYKISQRTISRWMEKGYLTRLTSESKREVYVNEAELAKLAAIYHKNPGQGKHTVKQAE